MKSRSVFYDNISLVNNNNNYYLFLILLLTYVITIRNKYKQFYNTLLLNYANRNKITYCCCTKNYKYTE